MENENKEILVLEQNTNSIVEQINGIVINDQETYENAVSIAKKIKEANNQVKEYWKEPKEAAAKAHKDICAKEKLMLEPLKQAESILKNKLVTYTEEQKRKAAEEERRIREEQERLALEQLQKAEELRKQGNEVEAVMVEQNAISISELDTKVDSGVQKVEGMSYRKDYDIIITDATKVPSYINGIEIRPVDVAQIKKLVKMTNNTIQIDGIEIKETKVASIRV